MVNSVYGGGGSGGSSGWPSYSIKMPDGSFIGILTGSFSSLEPYLLAGGRITNIGNLYGSIL